MHASIPNNINNNNNKNYNMHHFMIAPKLTLLTGEGEGGGGGLRIQAPYAVIVYKRPHKSNEALPARVTVPNHRSDFLEQRRTLSTGAGCWYYSTEVTETILIGRGRVEYRTLITMINSDWSGWDWGSQHSMSYLISVPLAR